MALRSLLAAMLAAAALPVVAAAQRPTPAPDGRLLRPGVDSLAIYVVRGTDTTRTGTLRDELSLVHEHGRALLQRVYVTIDQVLGTRVDTLVDVQADLRPVRHRSHTDRATESIDFAARRATGWLRLANGDSVPVDAAAAAFNASSFDLVLRASRLREGWSAAIPAFLPNTRAVTHLRARVVGVEQAGGERCWRVQAEFAGTPVTFWIGQASRTLRQQSMQVGADTQILFRTMTGPTPDRRST